MAAPVELRSHPTTHWMPAPHPRGDQFRGRDAERRRKSLKFDLKERGKSLRLLVNTSAPGDFLASNPRESYFTYDSCAPPSRHG